MEIIQDKSFAFNAPYDIISINDKSVLIDNPDITANAVSLVPFVSDRGRDNTFMMFRGAGEYAAFEKTFGSRNFRRHGQPIYNATETLKANGWCLAYRITADDATYANSLILAHVKVTDNTSVDVKIKTEPLTLTSTKTVEQLMEAKLTEADGYQVIPLFVVYSKGRGEYGNDISFRITSDKASNEYSDLANYNFETSINNRGSLETEGPYSTSIYPEARYNSQSIYIERMMTRISEYVSINACETGIEKLYSVLQPIANAKNVPVTSIDILCKDVTPFVNIDTATDGCIDVTTGIRLTSGTDGSWSGKFGFDIPTRSGMTKAFTDFYTGARDNDILNVLKIAPSYILDAGYPIEVKSAMVTLLKNRIDINGYFDIGFINTVSQAVTYMSSFPGVGLWNAQAFAQHGLFLDTENDKEVPVTATLFVARCLPKLYMEFGSHKPMAGETYGIVTGIIPGSLMPKANDLKTEKDPLYKAKLNYIEEGTDYMMFNTNLTLNTLRSKLSNMNNARMVSEMARLILLLVRKYRYEFTEPQDIAEFVRRGNETIAPYQDKVKSVSYEVTQTPYEAERGILRDKLFVKFKDIVEKNAVEINILGNNG